MKNIFKLLFVLLIPAMVLAQDDIDIGHIIGGGKLLGAKTSDNQTTVGILGIDSSGNTVIKALSGKTVSIPGTMDLTGAITTGALTVKPSGDANRLHVISASSDTALTYKFGDSGTTAAQVFTLSSSTADADDDSTVVIAAGGANGVTRGFHIEGYGNEVASTGGSAIIQTGNTAGADLTFGTVDDFVVEDLSGTDVVLIDIPTGEVSLRLPGGTIGIQESSAGAACMGTLTANGATPVVVSTTCATTGSRVLLSRTSAETGTVNAWRSALTNGVSFAVTSEAADTGTYDWFIIHEAP